MIKNLLTTILLIALLTACQGGSNTNSNSESTCTKEYAGTYKGTFPAADCSGIDYVLTIDKECTTYTMQATYLDAEGDGKHSTFTTKGKIKVTEPCDTSDNECIIELQPDCNEPPMFFKSKGDNMLYMVNDKHEEPDNGLRYILIKEFY